MFVADEGVQSSTITLLRAHGYSVYSIRENHQGIKDKEVLRIASEREEILITEDKDFGELAFRQFDKSKGIILVRLFDIEPKSRPQIVLSSILTHVDSLEGHFMVITSNKIRIRELLN